MSVRVMALVWEHAPVSEGELLVLLAIADHASDDGTNAWPSKATLARKARLSERRVQAIIHSLQDKGLIRIETQRGGTMDTPDRYRTNRYTVLLQNLTKSTISSGESSASPLHLVPDPLDIVESSGENSETVRGELWSTSGEMPTSPKPSIEPSLEPSIITSAVAEVAEPSLTVVKVTSNTIVAAYCDAWMQLHAEKPLSRQIGQIARESKIMLDSGLNPDRLLAAAQKCAQDGHARLDSSYAWITANPTRGAGQSKREQSIQNGLALVAELEAEENLFALPAGEFHEQV